MNNSYYQNPMFPGGSVGSAMPSGTPNQQTAPPINAGEEQSYIENILRLNKGKVAKFYMTYPDSLEWRDKIFTGIIEASGRDHIIISDPNTGLRHLLLIIYLDYVDFEEPINYSPIFGQQQ